MINYTTVFGKEDYRAVMTPHTEWYFTTPKRISNKGFVVTDGYLIEYAGDNYFSLHALYSKLAHGNPMHRFSKIIKRKSDGALLEDLIQEHLALKDLPKVADEKEEESKVKFNSVSDVIKNLELQQMAIKAYKDFDAWVEEQNNHHTTIYNLPAHWLIDRLKVNIETGAYDTSKYDKEYLRIMIAVFNNLVSNGAHSWEFYYFNYLDDEEPEGYVKDAVNFCFFGSYLLYHQYKTFKF